MSNTQLAARLEERFPRWLVYRDDFLSACRNNIGLFDRVLMNPPFDHGVDIKHIERASTMLCPGGRLVTVCANGPLQRSRRNVRILTEEVVRVEDDFFGPDWSEDRYRILACMGCGIRFFQHISTNADDTIDIADKEGNKTGTAPKEKRQYWPPFQHRKRPDWMTVDWTASDRLYKLTNEMYSAYHSNLPVLTAIGIRTVFDCATEVLGIDPGGTLPSYSSARSAERSGICWHSS